MKVNFHKYQGTGNDFIMIDNRSANLSFSPTQIQSICDRRFGIGADGVILLENHSKLDFTMNYYNADGSQSFCGNGSRCVVRFAESLKIVSSTATYEAIDGEHSSTITTENIATEMLPVNEFELLGKDYFINTGSPHYIIFTKDLESINIVKEAHKIRFNSRFKSEGTNVNFVEIRDNKIFVRTYERGVEGETLSCGTGVTAVAIAHCLKNKLKGDQTLAINTRGGLLNVKLTANDNSFKNIELIGPATKVFEGEFLL